MMNSSLPDSRHGLPDLLQWSETLAVGVDIVDRQHQGLIERANRFREQCACGAERRILGDLLDDLVDYSRLHFETEEQLLDDSHFSEEHREEHGKFVEELIRLQAAFGRRDPRLDGEILHFLQNWILHHVMEVDGRSFRKNR